jgi:tetratricopeptide (TPR) repeat protein
MISYGPTAAGLRLAAIGALAFGPALVPVSSLEAQPVVQALPDPATGELADALQRLARDPQSLSALLDAGRASLQLADYTAARGFFNRAQAIAPADGRVLAGLAMVELKERNPVAALHLFDRAERAGEPLGAYAADRGLAYDLVGANQRAQQLYGESLSRQEEREVLRRLALSYAIAGDLAASEATLLPLLQASDHAAFRTRAFVLAIGGRAEEAATIAETMLPAQLARRLTPYFEYMPQLTRAQQAAAANLGEFPRAAQIGRDDPEIAAYASGSTLGAATPPAPGGADARLIPGGQPLGTPAPQQAQAQAQQPQPQQSIPQPQLQQPQPQPQPQQSQPPPSQAPAQQPEPQPQIQPPRQPQPQARQPQPQVPPQQAAASSLPGAQGESAPAAQVPTVQGVQQPTAGAMSEPALHAAPPSAQVETVAPPPRTSLGEAFAEFELAEGARSVAPAAGAVDIMQITPIRQVQPAPAAAAPVPSRHWVQVATGRDTAAFRFDWRRIVRASDGLLEGRDAFYVPWNGSNRLITGPFASGSEAQEFVTKLSSAGVESFRFTSQPGEQVQPIP